MKQFIRHLSVALLSGGALLAHAIVTPGQKTKSASKSAPKSELGAATPEAVPGEFLIKLNQSDAKVASAMFSSMGLSLAETVNQNESLYLVRQDAAQNMSPNNTAEQTEAFMAKVAESPGVVFIEPNFIYRAFDIPKRVPSDAEFSKLWGLQNLGQRDPKGRVGVAGADIKAAQAWAIEQGSDSIVVAVIDTGIDYRHPDLKANIWVKPGTTNVHGFNAITGKLDPMDDHSHGTHCAGTIGGVGDNGVGVAGVAWNVKLMGVKFLSASGGGTLADAIKAIDWARENGAQIMSNSWGGGGFSEALKDAISRANDKGILFIAAAGNESSNSDSTPAYPASYDLPNVVSVAASNNSDQMASFSNFGRRTVHLMAPGENIFSTVINGGYDTYSGTSMACPHVSGAAALLLSKEPSLSPLQVRERLMRTSDKLRAFRTKLISSGRLNVFNLLTNTVPPGFPVIPDSAWLAPVTRVIETASPYPNNAKLSWTITREGAKFMRVRFTRFRTEAGYDILTLKNKDGVVVDQISGNVQGPFNSMEIDGDTIRLEFNSDESVADQGFKIESFQWTDFQGQVHTL